WNPERLFTWCAPRASRLFHPLAVSAALLLILAAVAVPAPDTALPRLSASYHLMVFVVVLNLVSILHECGHGIALHHYGGSAREIGIFAPTPGGGSRQRAPGWICGASFHGRGESVLPRMGLPRLPS